MTMMKFTQLSDELSGILQYALEKLPSVALALVIFTIFLFISRPLANFLTRPLQKRNESRLILLVVRRMISLLFILLGLYFLLRLMGLTQFAVALLSGTGVLGLIVGFAFKDIAENFLSSLLLSVQRPFKLGDIIEVAGYLGVVKKMTSRATTLVDFNGDHIQIPNATIYKNAIRNLAANPNMRGTFVVGIGYDVDVNQAQAIALDIMNNLDVVLKQPEPQVLVDSLGSSSCNLRLYFWVNNEENSMAKVASVLMKRVIATYTQNEFSMPDDARERIIINGDAQAQKHNTTAINQRTEKKGHAEISEDTSSDNDELRKQANQARDPEEGENIL